jgi:hypothetical protein
MPSLRMLGCTGPVHSCGSDFEILDLPQGWRAVLLIRSGGSRAAQRSGSCVVQDWNPVLSDLLRRWETPDQQRVLKRSERTVVFQTALADGRGALLQVVCKESRPPTRLRRLATRALGPKELHQFWAGHRLIAAGVATPLPVACLWRRSGRLEVRGRLVTEFVQGARGLDQTLASLDLHRRSATGQPGAGPAPVDLARTLGQAVGRLAAAGLYHRDLKASNFLVGTEMNEWRTWLIDLDGVHPDNRPCGPGFQRSLARLATSALRCTAIPLAMRLRVLTSCLSLCSAADWRQHWQSVDRAARKLLARRPIGKLADYE